MLIWLSNFLPPLANSEMYFGVRRNFSDKQIQKTTLYMHNIQTVGTQYLFACWFIETYKTKQNETVYSYAICLLMMFQGCAYSMRALCFEWAFLCVFFFLFFFHASCKCHLSHCKCQTARGRYPCVLCAAMPDCEWKTEIYEVMTLANRGAGQTSRRRRLQKQFVADGHASHRARLGCLHSCVWSGPRQCGSSSFRDHTGSRQRAFTEKKQTCKKTCLGFLQTLALVGGLSSAPRPRVNTAPVSAGYI